MAQASGVSCDGPGCRRRGKGEVNAGWLRVQVRAYRHQEDKTAAMEHVDTILDFHSTECLAAWATEAPAPRAMFPSAE